MQKQSSQKDYFRKYLSLAPVLAVITISIAFSIWAIFNFIFPDLLFHPMP
ncbi:MULTISPECIES: PsaJ protein [unclassified Anabaena]|nr:MULTISPECIES: PsaJ protein [unclassified Anabaena]